MASAPNIPADRDDDERPVLPVPEVVAGLRMNPMQTSQVRKASVAEVRHASPHRRGREGEGEARGEVGRWEESDAGT